jgi:hypothetical protein
MEFRGLRNQELRMCGKSTRDSFFLIGILVCFLASSLAEAYKPALHANLTKYTASQSLLGKSNALWID